MVLRAMLDSGLSLSQLRQTVVEENAPHGGTEVVGSSTVDEDVNEPPARRLESRTSRLARRMKRIPGLDEDKARRADKLPDELEALLSG